MEGKYNLAWLREKCDNGEKVKYLYFWGHTKNKNEEVGNFCFSQWFESAFTVDEVKFKTSEHWMMAEKAKLFGDMNAYEKIIQARTPGEAKDLGRKVKNFKYEIWEEHRYEIVKQGNLHKFGQNELLKEYLLQTKARILVEASPVDTIWGVGLAKESEKINNVYQWRGLNLLGFVLMEVRDEV